MKKFISIISILLIISCIFCACSLSSTETTAEATIDETSPTSLHFNDDNINNVLKIYEESMKDNISVYCEEYLTYSGTPIKKLESVKDIITDDYYNQIKSTEKYNKVDKGYEQATALKTLYYSDYSSPSDNIKVLAQCYQSVIVNNNSTTYNTFYVFDMQYDATSDWLINGVDKPANEYLKE